VPSARKTSDEVEHDKTEKREGDRLPEAGRLAQEQRVERIHHETAVDQCKDDKREGRDARQSDQGGVVNSDDRTE